MSRRREDAGEEKHGDGQQEEIKVVENVAKEGMEAPPTGNDPTAAPDESPLPGDTTIVPDDSPNGIEAVTPALDVAPPTPSSADKEDAGRREVIGSHLPANEASATSTPRSLSVPLPEFEPPSSTSLPAPPFLSSLEGANTNPARPRPLSVVSTSPSACLPFTRQTPVSTDRLLAPRERETRNRSRRSGDMTGISSSFTLVARRGKSGLG
jgi:hypothetical protein